jgi:hypothetical protein
MGSYSAPPMPATPFRGSRRTEFVFAGVEQAGPSFEGRVFLNHPDADETTAQDRETGYAGSFHVYGYGGEPPAGGAPVAPIEKRLLVDEAALGAALEHSDELTITVVPVPLEPGGPLPERPFTEVQAVFDRDATG